ncbi:hypothetical protein WI84_04645 [Burkholderia ubonensis]|uniref:DUF2491 family protein n=1 Tax=Burkholderia ubonensis TaxID=101571 RepID=UPI000758FF5C|nr:DUF2491 family protein [Burkholderia ubonensis]KVD41964.1 hypothetical protein WI84_04645 [Burkholderia ubonensis]
MGILELARRIGEKRLDDFARARADRPDRVDTGLPLGARIGGMIELVLADFALLEGTLLVVPPAAQMPIVAVSRLHIDADADLSIFRMYTDTGTDRNGQGAFLQVMTARNDFQDVREIAYYQFLYREYPVTSDEQDAFLGNGYGLGQDHYDMDRDELAQIAHLAGNPARVDALLGGNDAIGFERDAPGGDYIRPWTGRERRLDDSVGEKGVEKTHSFMQYVRRLPAGPAQESGPIERLWIDFEHVDTLHEILGTVETQLNEFDAKARAAMANLAQAQADRERAQLMQQQQEELNRLRASSGSASTGLGALQAAAAQARVAADAAQTVAAIGQKPLDQQAAVEDARRIASGAAPAGSESVVDRLRRISQS